MIRVEGHKNLYRDEKSGAIINYDSSGYAQYKRMKSAKLIQKSEYFLKNLISKLFFLAFNILFLFHHFGVPLGTPFSSITAPAKGAELDGLPLFLLFMCLRLLGVHQALILLIFHEFWASFL